MLHKIKGIVLYSIKYSESSLILHIYTDSYGRQSFLAYRSKNKKSKASAYLFHPLSLIKLEVDYKENREIQKIIEARFDYIFTQLYNDVRRSTIAIFLGEILNRNIKESEPNKQLFDFIYNAVQFLDVARDGIENFHLVFLIQLSKFLGFFPEQDFVLKVDEELRTDLHTLINISLTELNNLKISSSRRQQLLDVIIEMYQQHLTGTGQIQSLKILREVFA
jgi:DNA repair protein RecO (recombination protein O)